MISIAYIFPLPNKIFTIISLVLVLIIQFYELLYYVNKTNRSLSYFLDTLKDKDFITSTIIDVEDKSFKSLNDSFISISKTISETNLEKQAQFQLLYHIVDKIDSSILLLDKSNNISIINQAAVKQLNVKKSDSIDLMSKKIPEIQTLIESTNNSKKVIDINKAGKKEQVLVSCTPIKILTKSYKLITISNIQDELDRKEVQSWQKLLRTLSHEIMNSVAPISSLSETCLSILEKENNNNLKKSNLLKLEKGIKTIENRSSGLFHFVNEFRKLAKIPEPAMEPLQISELFSSVIELLRNDLENQNIKIETSIFPQDLRLIADHTLIEQVLINLILNAKDALINKADKKIILTAKNINNKTIIEVIDFGDGIPEKTQSEIFTPFYTTKERGSGIGLSLSRQIMQMHNGSISVKSELNTKTIFTLTF